DCAILRTGYGISPEVGNQRRPAPAGPAAGKMGDVGGNGTEGPKQPVVLDRLRFPGGGRPVYEGGHAPLRGGVQAAGAGPSAGPARLCRPATAPQAGPIPVGWAYAVWLPLEAPTLEPPPEEGSPVDPSGPALLSRLAASL